LKLNKIFTSCRLVPLFSQAPRRICSNICQPLEIYIEEKTMCRELLQDFLYHMYISCVYNHINIIYIDSTASGRIQIFHQDKTNQRDCLNIPPNKKTYKIRYLMGVQIGKLAQHLYQLLNMRYPSLAVPDCHPDLKLTLPTLKVKMITLLVKLPYFGAF